MVRVSLWSSAALSVMTLAAALVAVAAPGGRQEAAVAAHVVAQPAPPGRALDVAGVGTGLPVPGAAPRAQALPVAPPATPGYAVTASLPASVVRDHPARLSLTVTGPSGARLGVVAAGAGFTGCGAGATTPAVTVTVPRSGLASTSCTVTPLAGADLRVAAHLVAAATATVTYASTDYLTSTVAEPPPATSRVAGATWTAVSERAAALATTAPPTDYGHSAAVYGFRMRLDAVRHGWSSHQVAADYAQIMARVKPDGGWGLDQAVDAFGDGTINPATTSYLVTTADHVGPALLAGYRHAVVPRSAVQMALRSIVAMPRAGYVQGRTCLAYSNSGFDDGTCIWNVDLGAAAFLKQAAAAGVVVSGQLDLLARISATVKDQLDPASGYWPYTTASGRTPQDADHNGYTVASAAILLPGDATVASALRAFTRTPWWRHPVPPPTQGLDSFGYGLARGVGSDCAVSRSVSILEAYAAVTARVTDFDLQHAAWEGQEVTRACFSGRSWTPAAPRGVGSRLGAP